MFNPTELFRLRRQTKSFSRCFHTEIVPKPSKSLGIMESNSSTRICTRTLTRSWASIHHPIVKLGMAISFEIHKVICWAILELISQLSKLIQPLKVLIWLSCKTLSMKWTSKNLPWKTSILLRAVKTASLEVRCKNRLIKLILKRIKTCLKHRIKAWTSTVHKTQAPLLSALATKFFNLIKRVTIPAHQRVKSLATSHLWIKIIRFKWNKCNLWILSNKN